MSIIIDGIRREYLSEALHQEDLNPDPFAQFETWFTQAQQSDIADVNAMSLATADNTGAVSCRTVLLKGIETHQQQQGFVFFTNYGSKKAQCIADNPQVSLLFPWTRIHQQIEVVGTAVKLDREASCKYFTSRPYGSQIGAWASKQSHTVEQREDLLNAYQALEKKHPKDVPCPEFWGGYLVVPSRIEFWQGQANRLHDRLVYTRQDNNNWSIKRIAP